MTRIDVLFNAYTSDQWEWIRTNTTTVCLLLGGLIADPILSIVLARIGEALSRRWAVKVWLNEIAISAGFETFLHDLLPAYLNGNKTAGQVLISDRRVQHLVVSVEDVVEKIRVRLSTATNKKKRQRLAPKLLYEGCVDHVLAIYGGHMGGLTASSATVLYLETCSKEEGRVECFRAIMCAVYHGTEGAGDFVFTHPKDKSLTVTASAFFENLENNFPPAELTGLLASLPSTHERDPLTNRAALYMDGVLFGNRITASKKAAKTAIASGAEPVC
jgi:hypothetical protein